MTNKAPLRRSRRVALVAESGDTPDVSTTQLVDSKGRALSDAHVLTELGTAKDVKTILGVPVTEIFTRTGMLRPALLRQIHAAFVHGTTKNLVPDSDAKFGTVYWALGGLAITANDGSLGGNGFSFTGTGAATGSKTATSSIIGVKSGKNITVSCSLDATYCSGALPQLEIWKGDLSVMYGSVPGVLGQDRRVSFTITVPGGVTQLAVKFNTNNTTVSNTNKIVFSHPQVEVGNTASPYKPNMADDSTGYLKAGSSQIDLASGIHLNKTLDYVLDGVVYARRLMTRVNIAVPHGTAAAWYTVAKIPGEAGNVTRGKFLCKVAVPDSNAMAFDFAAVVNTGGSTTVHFHAHNISSTFNDWRIRQGADGTVYLELNITGDAAVDYTWSVQVMPVDGSFVNSPVASTTAGSGTVLMGPFTGTIGGHAIVLGLYSSSGIQHEWTNLGTHYLGGSEFINAQQQVDNANMVHQWNSYGIGALCTGAPLSASSAGSISVVACTYRRGSSTWDLVFNAVSNVVTGLSVGATRFIYNDDTTNTGGTKTWSATTSASTACNGDDRVCLGSATIPSSGSSGGGATGGSGCIDPDLWVDGKRRAQDLRWWRDKMLCSDGKYRRVRPTLGELLRHVWRFLTGRHERLWMPEITVQPRCRITADGIAWRGSLSTPFDLPLGLSALAWQMYKAPIRRADMSWTPVTEVELLDAGPVVHIHLGGHSFLAGETPDELCWNHNAYKP